MRFRDLACAAAIALGAAGCSKEPSVRLHITAPAAVPGDCVVVELTAPGTQPYDHLVPRDPGQDELWVAVFQGDWPVDVSPPPA